MLIGGGSAVLARTFISGVVLVSVQAWQEEEKHTAVYQLRASMVDLSNFLSYRIMAMSPGSLAGHAIFKTAWKTSGSLLDYGSSGEVTGGLLIQLSQLGANRVTY